MSVIGWYYSQLHDRMCAMSDPVDESFLDQYLEPPSSQSSSLDKPRPVRQGLPSGYRMRHDAHYVDELESRRRPSEAGWTGARVSHEHSRDLRAARHVAGTRRGGLVLQPGRGESAPVARAYGSVARARRGRSEHAGISGAAHAARGSAARARTGIAHRHPRADDQELRRRAAAHGHAHFARRPETAIQVTADARMLSLAVQACVGTLVSLVEASNLGRTSFTSPPASQTASRRARCARTPIDCRPISSRD